MITSHENQEFGEWLAGERKLPGFEANICEYIWSCEVPKCTRKPNVCCMLSAILHVGPFLLSTTVTPYG